MIKVIDALCGAGKTTRILEMMREGGKLGKKYLYITPFLTEAEDRIPDALPEMLFVSPKNKGNGKIGDLAQLVHDGRNIASTHALFIMLTPEIVDDLIAQQYTLIIDEALHCIGMMDNLVHTDVRDLLKSEMVIVTEGKRSKVEWNEDKYPLHDGKYADVRNMCRLGTLYAYTGKFLMLEYPPKLLSELNEVYVLTYLFDGSDMRCWAELNDIEYEYVDHAEFGLRPEQELKAIVRDNLEILKPAKLMAKKQRAGTLSKGWFEKTNTEEKASYKAMMRSCVVMSKAKIGSIFWTTYKSQQSSMAGAGYTKGVSEDMPSFLPLNTRATNKYADYWLCMYAANIFKNPIDIGYLEANGVKVSEDVFALSELIQFIFRGSIRNGKPMKVLVLSSRMRTLLEDWVNN